MIRVFCFLSLIVAIGCNSSSFDNSHISKCDEKITIDGYPKEKVWASTHWRLMDQLWLGDAYTEDDFSGKYKLLWDEDYLYVLAEIVDDTLIDNYEDGLIRYWDDDCLEIFVDEDASGGDHKYSYNAFAYHIALNRRVVDIGDDSLAHFYNHVQSFRRTIGNVSTWECQISLYDDSYKLYGRNESVKLSSSKQLGFAIAYCDNDYSKERENFIGSIPVEGEDKNRGWIDAGIFGRYVLRE